jgi:hypothetical protein
MAVATTDISKEDLISNILKEINDNTFGTDPFDESIYGEIRERLMRYGEDALMRLNESLIDKHITGIDQNQLSKLDQSLIKKLANMKRKGSGFDNELISSLEGNLNMLQYNTLLITCQQIKDDIDNSGQKEMMLDLIDVLTEKIQNLNLAHAHKREQSKMIPGEEETVATAEAIAGGATQEKLNNILDAMGINTDEFRQLFSNVTNIDLGDNFQEVLDNVEDDDIQRVLDEIRENATIQEHVEALGQIDVSLLESIAGLEPIHNDLKEQFGPFIEELLQLQINVILLLCKPVAERDVTSTRLNDILFKLNEKFERLNQLYREKDVIASAPPLLLAPVVAPTPAVPVRAPAPGRPAGLPPGVPPRLPLAPGIPAGLPPGRVAPGRPARVPGRPAGLPPGRPAGLPPGRPARAPGAPARLPGRPARAPGAPARLPGRPARAPASVGLPPAVERIHGVSPEILRRSAELEREGVVGTEWLKERPELPRAGLPPVGTRAPARRRTIPLPTKQVAQPPRIEEAQAEAEARAEEESKVALREAKRFGIPRRGQRLGPPSRLDVMDIGSQPKELKQQMQQHQIDVADIGRRRHRELPRVQRGGYTNNMLYKTEYEKCKFKYLKLKKNI